MNARNSFNRHLADLETISREEKCRTCRCFLDTLRELEAASTGIVLPRPATDRLAKLLADADVKHDCLGCEPCLPVPVSNALAGMTGTPSHPPACGMAPPPSGATAIGFSRMPPRWPVEPGEYLIGSTASPVAVCALGSDTLPSALADRIGRSAFALAGKTHTENIGIEKIVRNVIANARIRFLVLCGSEPKGHVPGMSLLALARNGIDDAQRIVGSPAQRPFLRNLGQAAVSRFRSQVEVIDLIGTEDLDTLAAALRECARRDPGPFGGAFVTGGAPVIKAGDAGTLVLDPAGFFIIYPRGEDRTILLEHYRTDGTLHEVITGTDPALIALAAVERGLVTRLDHAAYIGRELEKAYRSMICGLPYVQDSAPGAAAADAGASPPRR